MTAKQVANFIAKKYFTSTQYKEFKFNNSLEMENDASEIISLLKEEFTISEQEMDNYLDEIRTTRPMPKTELLMFLTEELAKQGLEWGTREELFKILCPTQSWVKFEDSWHQWITQYTEDIRNKIILTAIQNSLGFENIFWKLPEIKQKEMIPHIVVKFIESREKKEEKSESEFVLLKPIEKDITQEQKQMIEKIKEHIQDKKIVEKELYKNIKWFSKKAENQYFLLEVLPILYENSFYAFLNKHLFPAMLYNHRDNFYIKMKEVNTLINIDDSSYEEIYSLLDSITPKSEIQKIDILTMKVSTFRKFKFKGANMAKDELFDILTESIKYYNHIYQNTKPYNYYPAINLAYMLKLYGEIIPDSQRFKEYDIEKIYQSVKESIAQDKKGSKDAKFYATMSDFEFCLLLQKKDFTSKIEEGLERLQPSKFLIERPLFQMIWFVNLLEEFSKQPNDKLIESYYKAIDIFERHLYLL